MDNIRPQPLIAVDVGNGRIKLGRYDDLSATPLPAPTSTLELAADPWDPRRLADWVARLSDALPQRAASDARWAIASVNRSACARLVDWIDRHQPGQSVEIVGSLDVPISVALAAPERVGVDRLLAAWAANRLRDPDRPAITIDMGTAVTVDLIGKEGAFLGGAILPGLGMSARALAQQTDLLPHVPIEELGEAPPALGTATESAIRSGLFWGIVGAMRELIDRLSHGLKPPPQVFVTGGAAPSVAERLGHHARYVPHLVLDAIAGVEAKR